MSAIIRKSLLEFIFSGAFMKRWNDKLRPIELVEVDKQGHKMIVAWMLYMLNSRKLRPDARLDLGEEVVEGGIFDYLYRLVITDIKPPVFYRIKANKKDYDKLTRWVLSELKPRIMPLGPAFTTRMELALMDRSDDTLAQRILRAAHLYASYSEFKLIKDMNPAGYDMAEIEQSFVDRLKDLRDVVGVSALLGEPETDEMAKFAGVCGYLRFQKRWSQTPRVPETTVLGHMFLVAAYSWFFSFEVGACRARKQNNFFTGLFHDLPELLTRDIISPVKQSSPEIADLIKEYEEIELQNRVLGPLTEGGYSVLAERLAYFLGLEVGSEFKAACIKDGAIREITSDDLRRQYNHDEYDARDGELLKVCDQLAAYIEANTAIKNGISVDQLHQACFRIRQRYRETPVVAGLHVGSLLADFD